MTGMAFLDIKNTRVTGVEGGWPVHIGALVKSVYSQVERLNALNILLWRSEDKLEVAVENHKPATQTA